MDYQKDISYGFLRYNTSDVMYLPVMYYYACFVLHGQDNRRIIIIEVQ